jgi:hypothetical protein
MLLDFSFVFFFGELGVLIWVFSSLFVQRLEAHCTVAFLS